MSDFFVEFEIADEDRFQRLAKVFDAIRAAKDSGSWPDDNSWLEYFDAAARSTFWWPTQAELDDFHRRWTQTPVAQRFTDPSLKTPWMLDSMIDAFRNGEYQLISCERMSPQFARLTFEPLAGPFGGTECMEALIRAFGHRITIVSD